MRLEHLALSWLRFEKRCHVAMFERSPRSRSCGEPDVIGVTKSRHFLEIEIKRSLSDFRANKKKPFHRIRDLGDADSNPYPKQFWFLVPAELVDKVRPELPRWAGLLRGPTANEFQIASVVHAPVNKGSRRLSAKEVVRFGRCMANQIYSFSQSIMNRADWESACSKWAPLDYQI